MSVCSHILKKHVQTSQNCLHTLAVAVARSSSDENAIRCVLPVLWMTSCLPLIGQAKATPVLKLIHQGAAASGAKSDVCDCLVLKQNRYAVRPSSEFSLFTKHEFYCLMTNKGLKYNLSQFTKQPSSTARLMLNCRTSLTDTLADVF